MIKLNFKNIVLCLGFISVLAGFAYAAKYPNWLLGKSEEYTDLQYITAVGEGRTLNRAIDQAKAFINRVIEMRVNAVLKSIKKSGKGKTEADSRYETEINKFAGKVYDSVETKKTWYNSLADQYYVLMVLDKDKVGYELVKAVNEQEDLANKKLEQMNKSTSLLEKHNLISQVIKAYDRKREIVNKKIIIDSAGYSDMSYIPSKEDLEQKQKDIAGKLIFYISSQGFMGGSFENSLKKRISKYGFKSEILKTERVQVNASNASVRCTLEMQVSEFGKAKWKLIKWYAKADFIKNDIKETVISSTYVKGEMSGPKEAKVKAKISKVASKMLEMSTEKMIKKYMYAE